MERPIGHTGAFRRAPPAPIQIPALADVSGMVRLQVGDERAGAIAVQHGSVTLAAQSPEYAAACLHVSSLEDFLRIVRGELNAVVAAIQGRLVFSGDIELGVRVILALNAAQAAGSASWTVPETAAAAYQGEPHAS